MDASTLVNIAAIVAIAVLGGMWRGLNNSIDRSERNVLAALKRIDERLDKMDTKLDNVNTRLSHLEGVMSVSEPIKKIKG